MPWPHLHSYSFFSTMFGAVFPVLPLLAAASSTRPEQRQRATEPSDSWVVIPEETQMLALMYCLYYCTHLQAASLLFCLCQFVVQCRNLCFCRCVLCLICSNIRPSYYNINQPAFVIKYQCILHSYYSSQ